MIGAVIKKRRLELNLSQESLCKGICAISYLSKIETGQVTASEQVIELLLEKLGVVMPEGIIGVADIEQKIKLLWEHVHFGRFSEFMELYDGLKEHDAYLSYSKYAIDWVLLKICADQTQYQVNSVDEMVADWLAILENYKPFFTSMHSHYYEVFKGNRAFVKADYKGALKHYERALQFYHNGVTLFFIVSAEYSLGNYINAIRLGSEAYTLLMDEGNLKYAIENTQILAAAYSNVKQLDHAVSLYNRLLHIGQFIKEETILTSVYYNLGATYLACKAYDKAVEVFENLKPYLDDFDGWQWILSYQKLILCDIGLGLLDEARAKLTMANDKLKGLTLHQEHSLVLSFKWLNHYMTSDNPVNSATYLEAIRATYDASIKDSHYGFTLFYSDYLIEALKLQRRYKEAMEIKESLID